jgi:hypothetical protein
MVPNVRATEILLFLGAFAKLRKVAIRFIMSVGPSVCLFACPSVRMEQLSSHWTDFYETWYLNIFLKSVQKIQVILKSDKNNGYFAWRSTRFIQKVSTVSL